MSAFVLAALLLIPPRVPWRPVVATVLIWEDFAQSAHMKGRETNPLLGEHPSTARLAVACLLAVAANWIPWKHRDWIGGVTIGAETFFIISNALQREPDGTRVWFRWKP